MTALPLAGQTLGAPNGSFIVAEWTEPPCPPAGPIQVAPLHRHLECDEAWYVLAGTLCVQKGDETVTAPAGSAVFVERGVAHTYWNPNPEEARYLLLMTPRTHALIEAIHATPDRSMAGLKALFTEFGAELLG